MASKAVEVPATSSVPALAETPATQVTFEDIAPPTLYVAQRSSTAVGEGVATYGDLFIAQGADDPEPTVVRPFGDGPGVVIYPLHMYKTWTFSDGQNLQSWPYGDGTPPADAPEGVFRTYNFVLFVPDYDDEMPVNFRLNSKSQRPAANKINYVVSREHGGVWHEAAFSVTTTKRESGANKWAVPVVVEAQADKKLVDKAARLYEMILPGLQARSQRAEAAASTPAI